MSNSVLTKFVDNRATMVDLMHKVEQRLAKGVLDHLDISVNSIIEHSMTILTEEDQQALKHFEGLYQDDESQAAAEEINADVDDLVAQIQAQMEAGEEVKVEESDKVKSRRLALSGIQKHLEAVHTTDEQLRSDLTDVITELQCHDRVRQVVEHLSETFATFATVLGVHAKNPEVEAALDKATKDMYERFTMKEERESFLTHMDFTIEQLNDPDYHFKVRVSEFARRYVGYYKEMATECVHLIESAILRIAEQLNKLIAEAERLSSFSSDSIESMKGIKEQLTGDGKKSLIGTDQIQNMTGALKHVGTQTDAFFEKIAPILNTLQFQDFVHQNVANLTSMLFIFQQAVLFDEVEEIEHIFNVKTCSFKRLGNLFLKRTTMRSERDVIRDVFKMKKDV